MASTRKSAPASKKAPSAPRKDQQRGSSSVAEHRAHTPEVVGSTPAPASSKLTPQKAKFVAEYLKNGLNGRQAAIAAGYSAKSATQQASRLLTDANIKAAVRGAQAAKAQADAEVVRELTLDAERTRREIARLAYFDARRLFDKDGNPIPITDLDDDTAAALAGLDVQTTVIGEGDGQRSALVLKYKLADKNSALDKASKILGLFKEDNAQKGDPLLAMLKGHKSRTLGVVPDPPEDGG